MTGICLICGKQFRKYHARHKYCSRECYRIGHNKHKNVMYHRNIQDPEFCKKQRTRSREQRRKQRLIILNRLAALGLGKDGEISCAHCGCPYPEALTIGHVDGNRVEHIKEIGSGSWRMTRWLLTESDDIIISKNIRLECWYCNMYHSIAGEYPPENRLPVWPGSGL